MIFKIYQMSNAKIREFGEKKYVGLKCLHWSTLTLCGDKTKLHQNLIIQYMVRNEWYIAYLCIP